MQAAICILLPHGVTQADDAKGCMRDCKCKALALLKSLFGTRIAICTVGCDGYKTLLQQLTLVAHWLD